MLSSVYDDALYGYVRHRTHANEDRGGGVLPYHLNKIMLSDISHILHLYYIN